MDSATQIMAVYAACITLILFVIAAIKIRNYIRARAKRTICAYRNLSQALDSKFEKIGQTDGYIEAGEFVCSNGEGWCTPARLAENNDRYLGRAEQMIPIGSHCVLDTDTKLVFKAE